MHIDTRRTFEFDSFFKFLKQIEMRFEGIWLETLNLRPRSIVYNNKYMHCVLMRQIN